MKTVKDACELQPNALSIKLSDQVEQLDELITAEGKGTAFFEKTHITQGMQDLITEGLSRLAGASSQAVFHLKQAMGGGKTHLLVGFGLLARHPELRKMHCAGLPSASVFKSASIGAFNGRNNPDSFFWGEIANQLGKGEQFKAFWTSGPKAPEDTGQVRLRLNPQNVGPAHRIYLTEDGPASDKGTHLKDQIYTTLALRMDIQLNTRWPFGAGKGCAVYRDLICKTMTN